MKILAMDSSAGAASVSLCDDEKQIAGMTLDNGNKHSETLLPMTEDLLGHTGLSVDDIDLFAVTVGPGSFTGVRIGVSLVKGIAFGRGKPCVGVSSLEALAYNVIGTDKLICALIDARHDQFYNAMFRIEDRKVVRLCADRLVTGDTLAEELAKTDDAVCLVGDGAYAAKKFLPGENIMSAQNCLLAENAYSVALAAKKLYEQGIYTDDRRLVPVYLRASQAERERNKRLGIGN